MRLIYGFYLAAGLTVLGFLGWRAVLFFPEAWSRYADRGQKTFQSAHLDSTVFEAEPSGEADTTKVSQDTGLTALLTRLAPELGIASRRTSAISEGVPLYTVDFRKGVPLAERVQKMSDSLAQHGYRLEESSERIRAKYPWAARLYREDTSVALLRGRSFAPPSPDTYRLHVCLWSDSLTVPELGALEKLPAGVMLALRPDAFATSQLSGISRSRKLELAVLLRVETSLFPASLQERTRILLHHASTDIRRRILTSDSVARLAKGIVVFDGDRGARDPGLAGRLADVIHDNSWWLLDVTRTSASRLEDAAVARGAGILPQGRKADNDPATALEAAALQAESDGEAAILLKLDTTAVASLAAFVPLVKNRGVSIAPWPVLHRRSTGD
ncbi:MAG: hypothetical protein RL173_2534 [Fibrobacterota bacterium]|jgi:hypothetical protein